MNARIEILPLPADVAGCSAARASVCCALSAAAIDAPPALAAAFATLVEKAGEWIVRGLIAIARNAPSTRL